MLEFLRLHQIISASHDFPLTQVVVTCHNFNLIKSCHVIQFIYIDNKKIKNKKYHFNNIWLKLHHSLKFSHRNAPGQWLTDVTQWLHFFFKRHF